MCTLRKEIMKLVGRYFGFMVGRLLRTESEDVGDEGLDLRGAPHRLGLFGICGVLTDEKC